MEMSKAAERGTNALCLDQFLVGRITVGAFTDWLLRLTWGLGRRASLLAGLRGLSLLATSSTFSSAWIS